MAGRSNEVNSAGVATHCDNPLIEPIAGWLKSLMRAYAAAENRRLISLRPCQPREQVPGSRQIAGISTTEIAMRMSFGAG
jgi:hypothetical protein